MTENENVSAEKNKPTETEIKYARGIRILNERNVALENEVGRLTMINRAYEEQFRDMRQALTALENKLVAEINKNITDQNG